MWMCDLFLEIWGDGELHKASLCCNLAEFQSWQTMVNILTQYTSQKASSPKQWCSLDLHHLRSVVNDQWGIRNAQCCKWSVGNKKWTQSLPLPYCQEGKQERIEKEHVWWEVQSLCLFWVKGLLDADTDTASVDCRLMQNVVLSASPACPLPAFLYDCRFVNRLSMSLDVGFQYFFGTIHVII
jgi:hypothetical protein